MNFNLKTILAILVVLSISSTQVLAQDIKISDVLGDNDTSTTATTELEQQEIQREEDFLNQLLLKIPSQTDNPNHIITFIDPSEKKVGVQLEIDAKSFQEIKSPYSLPALSIGTHTLKFKFVDKEGTTQILEKELIVLPRPPIINSPTQDEGIITISGTGLANSEIILILSSSSDIVTKTSTISGDGIWEIKIEEELPAGIYSFTGYTRKYGYAGNLAEAVTFEYGTNNSIGGILKEDIHFSFKDIDYKKLGSILLDNTDLLILSAIIFALGFALPTMFIGLVKMKRENKALVGIEKRMTKQENSLTLLEKLRDGKKEETKEEKIVTKIDFLKDYKKFDPDEGKKEVKVEDDKKIKVSLTSKG
ncbi:MAG: hypothetical protein AB9915_03155 [Candidatus Dojkabacteria bacterium]